MNSYELADLLYITEPSLRAHWKRLCESQAKRGVYLYKRGRGENAEYGVKFPWESDVVWDTDELEIM